MNKEELFSEFHRILKEQGQGKNCFEVFNEDKTKCIFYIEATEPNQIIKSIAETLNNSVNRTEIDKAREKIDQAYEDFDGYDPNALCKYSSRVDEILDKLVESEDK